MYWVKGEFFNGTKVCKFDFWATEEEYISLCERGAHFRVVEFEEDEEDEEDFFDDPSEVGFDPYLGSYSFDC